MRVGRLPAHQRHRADGPAALHRLREGRVGGQHVGVGGAQGDEVGAVAVAGVVGAEAAGEEGARGGGGGDGGRGAADGGDEGGGVVEGDEEGAVRGEGGLEVGEVEAGGGDVEVWVGHFSFFLSFSLMILFGVFACSLQSAGSESLTYV